AVAAGHPLTAQAGARALAEGGNAVDACVAAAFAAAVTESPFTGPGSGGFMLIHRASDGSTSLADFFVAGPGLGGGAVPAGGMQEVGVSFGAGTTTQMFLIGPASAAVPGTVAGLEATHMLYGRLPWSELLTPGIELARNGVALTESQAHIHALLDPILRFESEGRRVYSNEDGSLPGVGDRLRFPDLAATLEAIASDGAAALYEGERAQAILATVQGGGGALTAEDLAAYRVEWRRPVEAGFGDYRVLSNPPPSSGGVLIAYGLAILQRLGVSAAGSADALGRLIEVMREQTRARDDAFARDLHDGGLSERLLGEAAQDAALERILASEPGTADPAASGTTHISVLDGDGNAAALSTSTGSGSGVIVPGTGIYLNNMLGEADLVSGAPVPPGRRLTSMMAPTIALDPDGAARLVVGSAGSARLRGAIMQVVVNVLEHGMSVSDAIDSPRVHVDEPEIHCEGGHLAASLDELEELGYELNRWPSRNLFFGGVAAVEVAADGTLAAAGDPRRGGAGVVVSEE
ncbi:MAG TPA: gamma-glutamyltransferase, partial [Gaiellaceae bacterium]|nr:gamma-glutamyltransferase [Gaiellaceae bacterium]